MDRKIELEQLSEDVFQEVLHTVSEEVLAIGKDAQNKINELLSRFNIRCDLSLNYSIISTEITSMVSPSPVDLTNGTEPIKKKRTRKKKTEAKAH